MYFENFPLLYYTLDDNTTGQVIQDVFRRVVLSSEIRTRNVLYETYDIQDGDTPEMLSDKFYNDPSLYWVILLTNEILDPRFDWPMEWYRLEKYINKKYPSNLYLQANVAANFNKGETVVQSSTGASARILESISNKLLVINSLGNFTNGGNLVGQVSGYYTSLKTSGTVFEDTSEQTHHYEYTGNSVIVDVTTFNSGNQSTMEAVSNRQQTIRENDVKRSIKILKPEFVTRVVEEFRQIILT